MYFRKILLLLSLSLCGFSKDVNLDFIKKQPAGIARDFYIWYFIDKNSTSIDEAKQAYDLVFKKTSRIESVMEKKGVIHEMPRDIFCKKLDFDQLKNEDIDCIVYGLKLSNVLTLKQEDADLLLQKLQGQAQAIDLYEQIKILRSDDVTKSLMQASAKNFAAIFTGLTYVQKLSLLEKSINPKNLARLLNENNPALNRVMTTIILDAKFDSIKKALGKIEVTSSDTNTFFLLGINELMLQNTTRALSYFSKSQNSAYDPFMRDRALFWQYLVSEDEKYLQELQTSTFVDIFSIYANQKLKTTPNYKIVSEFNLPKDKKNFEINNPFTWQIARSEVLKLDGEEYENKTKDFLYQDTLPHYLFFLSRKHRYQYNYFIFAYDDPKMWRDNEQKAITYAVARQESHLLPALVSTSYALGMMQIMPFNVMPFARDMGLKNISYFDMFDPKTALQFGSFFLDQLKKEFKHPLFVAYAYNGGPGFLRRTLEKQRLFLQDRKYEPWISLELLPYEESRFYGMKVLANYLIYMQMLNQEIDLESLLQETLIYKKGK
ncbi:MULTISPECIES: lytic transglycosylase domain-containing protein [unclassified Helicobacter]|uniref:lytic transglycosylase domain-containing protein n=1 Tax=unclassified Helicobacter TaxID=2593540 RepID=UPI000CF055BB|nr:MULTISPECIES: lytic transglycosylase domain-containing protein [unclassified Helicobacter]